MKHVVSFSGGRTSAYLVHLMEQKRINDKWDVDYIFLDTGAEHPKTYKFVRDVAEYFDIEITCLKAKINKEHGVGPVPMELLIDEIGWNLDLWADMVKKYGVPYNQGGAFCTDRMKAVIYQKYCNKKYGKGKYLTWLGIRIDEKRRLREREGYKYLAEISSMTKNDINGFWRDMPFDLEIEGDWLGNCVFCIKKGANRVALAMRDEPELAKEFAEMLEKANPEKRNSKGVAYRGKLTLDGVAQMFSHKSYEELKGIVTRKRHCGVSQGESCEVFGCQGDLFGGNEK